MISEPEVYLSEATHQYFHASGKELFSVTTAFEKVGITDFSKVPFAILEPARIKGDMVHEMAAYYGLGLLDESSVDHSLGGYLDAIKKYYTENVKRIIAVEQPVYSLKLGLAGTPDIVYENHAGEICLDDFKTPIKLHISCKWQTAAYAHLHEKMHKVRIQKRHAVQLKDDGFYFLDPHTNPLRRDLNDFMAIYAVAVLKTINKIK